jgi:hypothetical protein
VGGGGKEGVFELGVWEVEGERKVCFVCGRWVGWGEEGVGRERGGEKEGDVHSFHLTLLPSCHHHPPFSLLPG